MTEYYIENFESYSELFKEHAVCVAELMKILDDEVVSMGLPPVARTKELFRMVLDLSYHVDQSYKKKHGIDESDYEIKTFMSEKDVVGAMRNVLKEEFANYMAASDGDK
jgi:hypothetical protein